MPGAYSDISARMTGVLWERLKQNGHINELSRYVKREPDDIDVKAFEEWLMNPGDNEDIEIQAAQSILEIFEDFSPESGIQLPTYDEIMVGEAVEADRDIYVGIKGIRSAVIRFLSSVIEAGADVIYLYSDQNMKWMVSDRAFLIKWAVFMRECVNKGTRIRIIHNIDRSLTEMTEAIRSWLPLYMSGMIEPYYRDKRGNETFSHSLFLCPGLCCVSSAAVSGTESGALYHFYEDDEQLAYSERAFNELLSGAKPLLSVKEKSINDNKPLSTAPFNNIRIMISDDLVRIIHLEHQGISFDFTHPLMCRAFRHYAERLKLL